MKYRIFAEEWENVIEFLRRKGIEFTVVREPRGRFDGWIETEEDLREIRNEYDKSKCNQD